jgi:threonine/homoserine/homoserine lactone efflux protein
MNFKYLKTLQPNLKVARMGCFISFLGSLPPGVINLLVLQLGLSQGWRFALYFALGAVLVEILCVWLILRGMTWLTNQKKFFRLLELASLFIIFLLAIEAGWAVFFPKIHHTSSGYLPIGWHPFLAGILFRMITPQMIPYWLGWNMTLLSRDVLKNTPIENRFYLSGIMVGTLSAYLVYVSLGNAATGTLVHLQIVVNWLIFIVLVLAVLAQSWKLRKSILLS